MRDANAHTCSRSGAGEVIDPLELVAQMSVGLRKALELTLQTVLGLHVGAGN